MTERFSSAPGWIDDATCIWGNRTAIIPRQETVLVDVRSADGTPPVNWHVYVATVPAGCAVTVRCGAGGAGLEFNSPAAGGWFTVAGSFVRVIGTGQAGGAGGVVEAFAAPAWCPVSTP